MPPGERPPAAEYSLAAVAARLGKFSFPDEDPRSIRSTLDYGYHFDTLLYRAWLREHAQRLGVLRVEGNVVDVRLDGENGFIEAVVLEGGERIAGDLFVDASGVRGVLIEGALRTGYESWSDWLPCNRAVAWQQASTSATTGNPLPCTRATALSAGWSWEIPLQGGTGAGYVYCDGPSSDEEAAARIPDSLEGVSPRWLRFTNGRRRQLWNRNCVAIGAAGAFLEPLESSHLHLIHSGISRLITLFPYRNRTAAESAEYNRLMNAELEGIRDLLILHYHATARDSSELWRRSTTSSLPETLERRVRLFRSRGRVVLYDEECFPDSSWLCVLTGQQVWPERIDLLADTTDLARVREQLTRMRVGIRKAAEALPDHGVVLGGYCGAERRPG
jgi:tryptophan halogenase